MSIIERPIITSVGNRLRKRDALWDIPPEQGHFERNITLNRLRAIHTALGDVAGTSDYLNADQALQESEDFVNNAFDVYEGKVEPPQFKWAFAVPGRNEDFQDDEYASEVTPFLPLLDPQYGVDPRTRQYTVAGLAPSVIETYQGRQFGDETGAIVWTPFYLDATSRIHPDKWREFVRDNTPGIRESISKTAAFVRQRLGADVMGLGATIPSFTQLGKSIHEEGLTTTTGHGGTVYLIQETVREVIERRGTDVKKVGLLGAGSIGTSWAELVLDESKYDISVYDPQIRQVGKLMNHPESDKVSPMANEVELLESSDVIVSAINNTLDLNALERAYGRKIDLTGKVIVDDSQPGSFNREEVEARGGTLVWVVGQDTSKTKVLHRVDGYNFGDTSGLYGEGSLWGCEAEAASIYLQNRKDLAILGHVRPDMAVAIGGLMRQNDIKVATPLQSFGKPVKLDSNFPLRASGL